MCYHLYIQQSEIKETYYIGVSDDPKRRLDEVSFSAAKIFGFFVTPEREGFGDLMLDPKLGNALLKRFRIEIGVTEKNLWMK